MIFSQNVDIWQRLGGRLFLSSRQIREKNVNIINKLKAQETPDQ